MKGLLGIKKGMTQVFDEAGKVIPVTVIEAKPEPETKLEVFKPGDAVFVSGRSIGKGFAGTVKRYHFNRGPMSHGSKSHRLRGSSGAGTSPGRVLPGTRMSGRMGGEKVTVKNLKVVQVVAEKNLLLLKGAVPGKKGNLITIWS